MAPLSLWCGGTEHIDDKFGNDTLKQSVALPSLGSAENSDMTIVLPAFEQNAEPLGQAL